MLGKLKRLATAGWFLSLIGVILVSCLIWFVGPLIAVAERAPLTSVVARLVAILVVFALWGLFNLYKAHRRARENAAFVETIESDAPAGEAEAPQASAADAERESLAMRLDEALAKLKEAKFGEKGDYLYQLPWYAIIGPPAAGKTTALLNSGLSFPLDEHGPGHAVKGVGGTRYCDWWFTDKAVLIDTAGRYTVQDTDELVDAEAWHGFLDVLKKRRPRRPLNGVIVAISAADLIAGDDGARRRHADAIRKRIEELNARLKVNLPIYVMVTKTDLLDGFTEFFEKFGLEEREQVWGVTAPADRGASVARTIGVIREESDELARRLSARMFDRLNEETDFERRRKMFGFPQQFAGLRRATDAFLRDTFQESRFTSKPFLRGLYFTSGTQEGAPIDRLLGSLATGLKSDDRPELVGRASSRGYFLNTLFGDVIFGEAELVGADAKAARRERIRQYAAIAAGAAVLTVATGLWLFSYARNASMLADLREETALYAEEVAQLPGERDVDVLDVLPPLDRLRAATFSAKAEPAARRSAGFSFGLGQTRKARRRLEAEYEDLLETAFLPRILAGLEQELRANVDRPADLFKTLRIYLMAGGQGDIDKAAVLDWLAAGWAYQYREESRAFAALNAHADQLFSQAFPPQELDEGVIAAARDRLRAAPLAELLFAELESAAGDELVEWSLRQNAGTDGGQLFADAGRSGRALAVSGLYTADGYRQYARSEMNALAKSGADAAFVLGNDAAGNAAEFDPGRLLEDIEEIYFNRFSLAWKDLISDLAIRRQVCGEAERSRGQRECLERQARNIRIATGAAGPLTVFIRAVADATDLTPQGEEAKEGALETLERSSGRVRQVQRLRRRMRGASGQRTEPVDNVIAEYEALREFVTAPEGQKSDLVLAILRLDEYGELLDRAAGAIRDGAANAEALDFAEELAAEIARYPQPARRLFETFVSSGAAAVSRQSKGQLTKAFSADVAESCAQAISGRFPFAPDAPESVRLGDFQNMFGPGGAMERFFDQNLRAYVDDAGRTWRLSPEGEAIGLSPATPRKFENARRMKRGFFANGRFGAEYSIQAIDLDPNATKVTLTVDGAEVEYRHARTQPQKASWPGPVGARSARVVMQRSDGRDLVKTWEGDWGLFRMLNEAEVTQRSDYGVSFRVSVEGVSAAFRIEADSVANPFSAFDGLSRVSCGGGL